MPTVRKSKADGVMIVAKNDCYEWEKEITLAYAFYRTQKEAQDAIDEFDRKTYAVNGGNWIIIPDFEIFDVSCLPPDDRYKNTEMDAYEDEKDSWVTIDLKEHSLHFHLFDESSAHIDGVRFIKLGNNDPDYYQQRIKYFLWVNINLFQRYGTHLYAAQFGQAE